MTEVASALTTFLDPDWPVWGCVLVFVRCAAAMAFMPAIGERVIPMRVKLATALAFALVVVPMSPLAPGAPDDVAGMALPILAETVSGLFLGLSLRLFVFALQVAGAIAAQSTSLAQIFASAGTDPLPAIGHVLTVSCFAFLMLMGYHIKFAAFLAQSHLLVPSGQFPNAAAFSEWSLGRVSAMFSLAFQLAAPFVILSVLYNITLGVVNRAMPQLMVAFVGAPVITLGSLLLLFVTAPLLIPVWQTAFDAFLANPAAQ